VVLKPGGIHMMMIGLKQQLNEGETVALTLMFEKAGAVEVTARIGKVAAMDDPDKKTDSGN
jgi:copper(I)-binding protein